MMNSATINNAVNLTYPDGFKEMGDEELTKYFSTPKDRWGAYNADDHIILSVSWTKAPFMTDAETVLFKTEARLCRNLLNYQKVTSFKMKIASKKAYGIRFEYRVNDKKLVQVADLIVFKHKNQIYSVYYVTRKINAGSTRTVFEEVLKSITVN